MSMELTEHANGLSEREARETVYLLGGVALVVFGAGLILSTPMIRRALGGVGLGNMMQAAIPDFQRYLKLRSM
jgi:hypothetical protein